MGSGCSDDFGDMNVNPSAVTEVDPAFFFVYTLHGPLFNYQRNVNLYADFYCQYWANIVSGFESPRYEYVDGWVGNYWREFYTAAVPEANAIKMQKQDDPLFTDALAINEIWMCYSWSRLTDYYGDVPYFGAGEGKSVPYNAQKDIYYDLFTRLDAAVKSITGDAEQYNYRTHDYIYNGNALKWRQFGNSLRLRLAMRLSNVDPTKAKAEAQAAVNGPGGLLGSNADVAKIKIWKDGWYDYLNQMAWNWDNIRCSKTFNDHLYNQSTVGEDPRTPKWFAYKVNNEPLKKEDAGFDQYFGIENGWNVLPAGAKDDYATINLKGGYVDFVTAGENQMFMPVMFYSEVLFLQAEAAMRGWISGDADNLYKAGIKASMDYVGVDAASANAYIAGIPSLTGANEVSLKQLITQKWIANFPNGMEGWADFRRTDYPDITLPKDGVSASASVATNTWVKRIRYPDNQHNQNEKNMPESLNTIAKDRMDIRVWWDTADTKTKGSNGLMNSNFK
jgi:hypothetical protein